MTTSRSRRRFPVGLTMLITAALTVTGVVGARLTTLRSATSPAPLSLSVQELASAHGHSHLDTLRQEAPVQPPRATGLILPEIDGPKPWSDAPHLNDPQRFHIAIMTDRTGGHRPGVWETGVEKVNLLRPEFVVSVGDLIEGYTEDIVEIERQWTEFLGFIDKMEMKFFFVPGNHDVTNPTMHKIWREHFGKEWYSFDYKGVHFVALNSEDPNAHLGEEQLAWLEQDLKDHADARWTLLFFHKPLWVYADRETAAGNPDPTNWRKVEKMLGGRPHTVFAGHVHHYVQYDRNGMNYFHLATTGGGSQLRGIPYGEFDPVTWLTMEKDGPRVTHLLLDGVLAPDVVTESGFARFRSILTQTSLQIAPILVRERGGFTEGRINLRFVNDFDTPAKVSGHLEGLPLRGLTVDPATLDLTAAPGETVDLTVKVRFDQEIPFADLAGTTFTARLEAQGDTDKAPLRAEQSLPVIIDQGFECLRLNMPVQLDGALTEWPEPRRKMPEKVNILAPGRPEDWTGAADADLTFDVTHDDQFVYVAARVRDDAIVPEVDGLELLFDPRPIDRRMSDPAPRRGIHRILVPAPTAEGLSTKIDTTNRAGQPTLPEARAASFVTGGGYIAEIALPVSALKEAHGHLDWSSFQLTLILRDQDQADGQPVRLLWRGSDRPDRANTRFGHFLRNAN